MRRERILNELCDNSVMILFSGKAPLRSRDTYYDFSVDRNFFYFTNLDVENVNLVTTKINGEVKHVLFIEKRDPKMVKWIGEGPNPEEVVKVSGITDVRDIKEFDDYINSIIDESKLKNIYLDLNGVRVVDEFSCSKVFRTKLEEKYKGLEINNIFDTFAEARMFKTEEEIKDLQKAIDITQKGIEEIMKNTKAGLKEYQVVTYFDKAIRYLGSKFNAFQTIAASGSNAVILHYENNSNDLKDGDLLLLDLGAEYNNYSADISRTIPVNGKFTDRQKEIYELCLSVNEAVIERVKPGTDLRELNDYTKELIEKGLKELNVIEEGESVSEYYYHGVGHYLGLDTHDVEISGKKLQPGMVITIEPGIYIAKEEIGIRIEDDILVTEDGHINLSKNIIKSVKDIEDFMSNK